MSMGAAIVVLVVPLVLFTSIDRGWFGLGDDENAGLAAGEVRVELKNWEVAPSTTTAKAGEVTFLAVHEEEHGHSADEAGATHDLAVLKIEADGSYSLVGRTSAIPTGQSERLTLDLDPGDYELQCTVVEEVEGEAVSHYVKGMHTSFRVQ